MEQLRHVRWTPGARSAVAGMAIVLSHLLGSGQVALAQSPAAAPGPALLAGTTRATIPSLAEQGKTAQHPLLPALRWAIESLPAIERLKDYTAVLVRRERIAGELTDYETVSIKIRHAPFSVYGYFHTPGVAKGQEVLYIQGQNNGHLIGHRGALMGVLSLDPQSALAMRGRHYPLTEIGMVNLLRRLIEVGQRDLSYGECEVKYFPGAKLNDRPCTIVQAAHPERRDYFRFHIARIFVDDTLNLPVRYESYDWPQKPGGPPELFEEYTYLNLKLNVGLTDEDFSTGNPQYHFPRDR